MKKALVLGAAAMAALAIAPNPASAGEVKMGGYYMFRAQNTDKTVTKDAANTDDQQYWQHRLQMKFDMIASPKTHAHMVFRAFDNSLEGADSGFVPAPDPDTTGMPAAGSAGSTISGIERSRFGTTERLWDIRQGWLETEAWTVGLKVGFMPISLNDRILVNDDTTGFATVMLSKSFGDITVVGADVRVREGNLGVGGNPALNGTLNPGVSAYNTAVGSDEDDEDLYVLSLLGKASNVNYQVTGAYFNGGKGGFISNNINRAEDFWLAATAGGDFAGVNATGTLIWEAGLDDGSPLLGNATQVSQLKGGGGLGAVRLDGKTGFGGWEGYGFYASKNFTNITPRNQVWSATWDQGGPGGVKLMRTFATSTGVSNVSQNMWGVGAGLILNAQGWKINPMLDYAAVVKDQPMAGGAQAVYDDAWGGSLMLSTEIDKGTTLLLGGTAVKTGDGPGKTAASAADTMHTVQAAVKMAF